MAHRGGSRSPGRGGSSAGIARALALRGGRWPAGNLNTAHVQGFLALETWGNDSVSFPGRAFAEYLGQLYRDDALIRGTLRVSGLPVRLGDIRCPTMAVTFEHDNIVPWKSAAALLEEVGASVREHLHLPGGHVGAVVSTGARDKLWNKLSAFWKKHDG